MTIKSIFKQNKCISCDGDGLVVEGSAFFQLFNQSNIELCCCWVNSVYIPAPAEAVGMTGVDFAYLQISILIAISYAH